MIKTSPNGGNNYLVNTVRYLGREGNSVETNYFVEVNKLLSAPLCQHANFTQTQQNNSLDPPNFGKFCLKNTVWIFTLRA